MNGLQEWREWREMVDRSLTRLADVALDQTGVLRKLLERVEALERRTDWVCVAEESANVIDPVPQMLNDDLFRVGEPFALTYQTPEGAPTIVESSP